MRKPVSQPARPAGQGGQLPGGDVPGLRQPTCATGSTVPDAVDNPGPHSVARKRLADSSNSRGLARLAVSEKPSSTGRPRRNASMSRTEA